MASTKPVSDPKPATTSARPSNPKVHSPHLASDKAMQKFSWREPIIHTVLSLLSAGMLIGCWGKQSTFSFDNATSLFTIPHWHFPAWILCLPAVLIMVVIAVQVWVKSRLRLQIPRWYTAISLLALIICFLAWTMAGNKNSMPIITLLAGGLGFSVPLILGALSGVVCERTGVINIAIEGQLLGGAFMGVLVANLAGNAWLGLIGAILAGVLVAVLLALFTINLRTNHIIVGVVLNMLVLGLTNFLYSSLFVSKQYLNTPQALRAIKIPLLSEIPIFGPVLFNQSILVYLTYLIVIALQIGLFHTRWGLRSRACGEHPRAADTVGIKVNKRRWANVLLGGAIAGLGGAFFTLGSNLAFIQNTSAGQGFIALAAMIVGAWTPLGAVIAAVLFGFTTQVASLLMTVGSPVAPEYLLMIPYLITIFAVSGFVGQVRPPAAEGEPYPL